MSAWSSGSVAAGPSSACAWAAAGGAMHPTHASAHRSCALSAPALAAKNPLSDDRAATRRPASAWGCCVLAKICSKPQTQ